MGLEEMKGLTTMVLSFLETLTYDQFEQMMFMEQEYYGLENITPAEEAFRWYQKYPYTTIAASDGKEIAGFINLFPVKKQVFELLKTGQFNDHDLKLEDIANIDEPGNEDLNMYLCCIVVKEKYRKENLSKKLLQVALLSYQRVWDRCKWIITDNVTEKGAHFSEKYGLSFICRTNHGSNIYMGSFQKFVDRAFAE